MIIAIFFPHNEGTYAALITGSGFDSQLNMVDASEVDAHVKSFDTEGEATAWLRDVNKVAIDQMTEVPGGRAIMLDPEDY